MRATGDDQRKSRADGPGATARKESLCVEVWPDFHSDRGPWPVARSPLLARRP
jgi:hypothetical protein